MGDGLLVSFCTELRSFPSHAVQGANQFVYFTIYVSYFFVSTAVLLHYSMNHAWFHHLFYCYLWLVLLLLLLIILCGIHDFLSFSSFSLLLVCILAASCPLVHSSQHFMPSAWIFPSTPWCESLLPRTRCCSHPVLPQCGATDCTWPNVRIGREHPS